MTAGLPMLGMRRAEIDRLLAAADWQHLRPILTAVRDSGIGFVMALAGGERVDLAAMLAKRPCVILFNDECGFALGPAGFDPRMIETALVAAGLVVMVNGTADPAPYERAARFTAQHRQHSLVIETTAAVTAKWLALAAPDDVVVPV